MTSTFAKFAVSLAAASVFTIGTTSIASADKPKPAPPAPTAPAPKKTCTTTKTPIVDKNGFIIGIKTTTTCVIE